MKKIITNLLSICLGLIFASPILAGGPIIYHNTYVTEEIINQAVVNTSKADAARSTAASQHHFKSTSKLQWSVGAGFSGSESALSFGLGLQTGEVFLSGNITDTLFSGESDPVLGVGASGVF